MSRIHRAVIWLLAFTFHLTLGCMGRGDTLSALVRQRSCLQHCRIECADERPVRVGPVVGTAIHEVERRLGEPDTRRGRESGSIWVYEFASSDCSRQVAGLSLVLETDQANVVSAYWLAEEGLSAVPADEGKQQ